MVTPECGRDATQPRTSSSCLVQTVAELLGLSWKITATALCAAEYDMTAPHNLLPLPALSSGPQHGTANSAATDVWVPTDSHRQRIVDWPRFIPLPLYRTPQLTDPNRDNTSTLRSKSPPASLGLSGPARANPHGVALASSRNSLSTFATPLDHSHVHHPFTVTR